MELLQSSALLLGYVVIKKLSTLDISPWRQFAYHNSPSRYNLDRIRPKGLGALPAPAQFGLFESMIKWGRANSHPLYEEIISMFTMCFASNTDNVKEQKKEPHSSPGGVLF